MALIDLSNKTAREAIQLYTGRLRSWAGKGDERCLTGRERDVDSGCQVESEQVQRVGVEIGRFGDDVAA